MRKVILAALIAALVIPFAMERGDAMVRPMSLKELAKDATLIVRGHVAQSEVYWTENFLGKMIVTDFKVAVTDRLKGECGAQIDVQCIGGRVGNTTVLASEEARIAVGEDVVLFLIEHPSAAGAYQVYGWFQGKNTILAERVREAKELDYATFRERVVAVTGSSASEKK